MIASTASRREEGHGGQGQPAPMGAGAQLAPSMAIHPGGPLLAEAKLMLQKAGIETARPAPGATRQGWLTYREVPMVLVVEAKDRTALSDALGVLLHEGGCDRYLLVAKKDWCVL